MVNCKAQAHLDLETVTYTPLLPGESDGAGVQTQACGAPHPDAPRLAVSSKR